MRRSLITTILTALLALILVSAANAAVPNGQQNFLNLDAGLQPRTTWLSNQAFRLKSIYNNSLLGYGHRTFGVDLQWGDHMGPPACRGTAGRGRSPRPTTWRSTRLR